MTDTGSMEPSPEAIAWARRADAWAQQPAEEQGGQLEPVSRWSEVAPTGRQTTYTADGVGWRTETAEWLAAEQTARWRQTTEWRSASGDHGWRSTTEAWQTGGNAEGFTPPVDPSTRQQLAISGTAWPTPQSDDPQSAPPADGAHAGQWQHFTESPRPWEQQPATEARPAWQQFAGPTPPWQQGSGTAAPWQQGSAGLPPWQPGETSNGAAPAQRTPTNGSSWQQPGETSNGAAPAQRTPENGSSWQQLVEPTPAPPSPLGWQNPVSAAPGWQDSRPEATPGGPANGARSAPAWQNGAEAGSAWQSGAQSAQAWQSGAETAPGWQSGAEPSASQRGLNGGHSSVNGRSDGTPSWRDSMVARPEPAPSWDAPVSAAPSWQQPAPRPPDARPDRADTSSWQTPAPGASSAPYTSTWSGGLTDGSHLVREDDRDRWRREAAAGMTGVGERSVGRRRAPEPDPARPSEGTGWAAAADAPSWTGRAEAVGPRAISGRTGWPDRIDAPDSPETPSWHTGAEAPGRSEAPSRPGRADAPIWQGRADTPARSEAPTWHARPQLPAGPEPPGWRGRADAADRPSYGPGPRDRDDDPRWQDGPAAPSWRDRTGAPSRRADATDWRDRTEIRDWPDRDDRDYRDDRGSRADAPDWRDRTDIRDWPDRLAISDRPYRGDAGPYRGDDGPYRSGGPYRGDDRAELDDRPRRSRRADDDERDDPPTDWRNRSDGWRAEPDSGSWSRGEPRRDGWRRGDDSADEDTGDPGWRDAGPQTGDWRRAGRPATDPWAQNVADTGMIPMSWEQPASDTGSWRAPDGGIPRGRRAPDAGLVDPAVFQRDPAARRPDPNWPVDDGPQADWREQIRQEDGLPRPGEAVTEIRQRIAPETWHRAGQEPAPWQREAREQAARGSATYRAAGTDDWRKDLTPADLADGESRRFGTQDFVPFRPSGSASVPTPAASASVAPPSAPPAPVQGSQAQGPPMPAPLAPGRENLLVPNEPSAVTGNSRWHDPPDTQWPPRGAVTGSYERRAVGSLSGPIGRVNNLLEPEDDDAEQSNGGPLAAVGYTVIWYGVPVILFVLYILVFNGGQQAHALSTLASAAPQFGLSLVLSMLVAVGLRWASGSWKAASVGLAAAVMGGGLATVLTSAITGSSLS